LPLWPFLALSVLMIATACWWWVWGDNLLERRALDRLRRTRHVEVLAIPAGWPFRLPGPASWVMAGMAWIVPPPVPSVKLRIAPEAGRAVFEELRFVRDVTALDARGTAIVDEDLRHLRRGTGVQELLLDDTAIGDAGIEHLRGLRVWRMSLVGTRISDTALTVIGTIEPLEELDLRRTRIDGSGLVALAALKSLHRLNLGDTRVTDAGLRGLAGMRSLTWLELNRTPVTDAAIETIVALPNVISMSLDRTNVGDAGLALLPKERFLWDKLSLRHTRVTSAGLCRLPLEPSNLYLAGTKVDDTVLPWLLSNRCLTRLDLSSTGLTDDGLTRLREISTLRVLDVRGCPITDRGVFRLLLPPEKLPVETESPEGRGAARHALSAENSVDRLWLHPQDVRGTAVSAEVVDCLRRFVSTVEIRR
jgi:hypothetical protein